MLREFLTQYVALIILIFLVTAMFSLGMDLTEIGRASCRERV